MEGFLDAPGSFSDNERELGWVVLGLRFGSLVGFYTIGGDLAHLSSAWSCLAARVE